MPNRTLTPDLIKQLEKLHRVFAKHRVVLSGLSLATGVVLIAAWSQLKERMTIPLSYPVFGGVSVLISLMLLLQPVERLASSLMTHMRFSQKIISTKERQWLVELNAECGELRPHIEPILKSPYPTHIDALRKIWVRWAALRRGA